MADTVFDTSSIAIWALKSGRFYGVSDVSDEETQEEAL